MSTKKDKDNTKQVTINFDEYPNGLVTRRSGHPAAVELMHRLMVELNFDMMNPHSQETPDRFVHYLQEFMQKYDPEAILGTSFETNSEYSTMVVQSHIPYRAICAHHLVPVLGVAHVGYIANERVIGLSKLARLVDAVGTSAPGVQEEHCDRIANDLMHYLKPSGAMVVITAEHGCMACRGVNKVNVPTTTSAIRGVFRDNMQARAEFFQLVQQGDNQRR